MTFKDALDNYVAANIPTIVKRELVAHGKIRVTDSDGVKYLSLDLGAVPTGCFKDIKTNKYFAPITNSIETKDMLNANRDMVTFTNTYQNGLAEERRVIEFLRTKFNDVTTSTKKQNVEQDIDCFIGDIGVSIKAEHAGLKYGHIYFELENQLTATGDWAKDGWFYTGTAEKYVIIQGQEIRMYDKQAIVDYVEANGWFRTRTLGWKTKATQGGSYRTMDTLSGFLVKENVPYEYSWKVA